MKIVLDTTILVRANERSNGLAREILTTIVESEHRLLLSNEMLHELARVLRYPRLREFYGLTEDLIFDYVKFLSRSSEIVVLDPLVIAPIRDVNDIIVMQTAIIGEADVLCTKDDDFFEDPAKEYLRKMGVAVLDDITPNASLALLMFGADGSAPRTKRHDVRTRSVGRAGVGEKPFEGFAPTGSTSPKDRSTSKNLVRQHHDMHQPAHQLDRVQLLDDQLPHPPIRHKSQRLDRNSPHQFADRIEHMPDELGIVREE